MQRFHQEAFGGLGISRRAQEKLERVPFGIDGSVQVHPDFLHLDVRLIHSPGVIGGFEMRSTALVEFRGIPLDPAVDGRMIDAESALSHHLFQVAVAQCIAQVPADAQENYLAFKGTPFERILLGHKGNSSAVLEYSRVYHSILIFATEPTI